MLCDCVYVPHAMNIQWYWHWHAWVDLALLPVLQAAGAGRLDPAGRRSTTLQLALFNLSSAVLWLSELWLPPARAISACCSAMNTCAATVGAGSRECCSINLGRVWLKNQNSKKNFRHLHGELNLDEIKNALRLLSVNAETNLMNLIRLQLDTKIATIMLQ